MTDDELVRLCAEKVMGWEPVQDAYFPEKRRQLDMPPGWNPLANDADACAVLDALQAQGWRWTFGHHVHINFKQFGQVWGYVCELSRITEDSQIETHTGSNDDPTPEGRRRAIVLAALHAKGVEV